MPKFINKFFKTFFYLFNFIFTNNSFKNEFILFEQNTLFIFSSFKIINNGIIDLVKILSNTTNASILIIIV